MDNPMSIHYRTTVNLPTPSSKKNRRDEIAAEVDAFLARGGEIKEVAPEPAPIRPLNRAMTVSRKRQAVQ